MKQTAVKSTPQNNATVVNTLAESQQLIDKLSKTFGYDYIGSTKSLENNINQGTRNKAKNGIYMGNNMAGILNIGFKGKEPKRFQEDSILILSHPENEKFRIALVADGMGGQGNGDAASHIAISMTRDWFKELPAQFFNCDALNIRYQNGKVLPITFNDFIKKHLVDVNNKIVEQLGDSPGTTFSAAITRNKKGYDTVTSISIGDSKVLKISDNGQVVQLSKDDNLLSEGMRNGALYVEDSSPNVIYTSDSKYTSETLYKQKTQNNGIHILNEDDMRFYKKNNIITECLGCGKTRTRA